MNRRKFVYGLAVWVFLFTFVGISLADEKGKLNLNTATMDQLGKVPGLNKDLAKKLVDQRKKNGEFVDMEELLEIKGINKDLLRSLKKYILIKPASG
ncbi:MAG: competence protein ComEA, partial [Desulfobacca sp.]|nr:competence protein ComEA [Desulfobacca sp.]